MHHCYSEWGECGSGRRFGWEILSDCIARGATIGGDGRVSAGSLVKLDCDGVDRIVKEIDRISGIVGDFREAT